LLVTFTAPFVPDASAQDAPRIVGELAAGGLLFPDDGVVTEGAVVVAARYYVTPRVSVGPEVAYISGEHHSHLMLTGNVTFDFVADDASQDSRVTPFVVAGGGWYRTRESFPNHQVFTSSEGAFTAGGGIRFALGNRFVAGAEVRVGWELHLRLNGFVGVQFGR
jgi:hypothetical protein